MKTATHPPSLGTLWTGRIISALPALFMLGGGVWILSKPPQAIEGMKKFGCEEHSLQIVAALEVGSALLYAIPQTAMLGAILLTGYLGGAVATHLRIGDPGWPMAVCMGILVWLGLYLRDPRLRALVPLRKL
jgi:hypothetical protein